MPVLFFRLRNVPDDEADDIRDILNRHNFEFYETSAGNWGISTAAIWLKNKDDLNQAKGLIEQYQKERGTSQRQIYEQLKNSGKQKTVIDSFRENPLRFLAYCLFVAFIIYVSTKPFISLTNQASLL